MRMLSVEEAGRRLSVSPETVRRLVKRGELRARKIGGLVRIPEDAIAVAGRPYHPEDEA